MIFAQLNSGSETGRTNPEGLAASLAVARMEKDFGPCRACLRNGRPCRRPHTCPRAGGEPKTHAPKAGAVVGWGVHRKREGWGAARPAAPNKANCRSPSDPKAGNLPCETKPICLPMGSVSTVHPTRTIASRYAKQSQFGSRVAEGEEVLCKTSPILTWAAVRNKANPGPCRAEP